MTISLGPLEPGSDPATPPLIILGVCDRMIRTQRFHPSLTAYSLVELRSFIAVPFVPSPLNGLVLVAAVDTNAIEAWPDFAIVARTSNGRSLFRITVTTQSLTSAERLPEAGALDEVPFLPHGRWRLVGLHLTKAHGVLTDDATLELSLSRGDREWPLTSLQVLILDVAPLTPDRIAAIRSRPGAIKQLRYEVGCAKCLAKLKVYCALERVSSTEDEGFTWYEQLPDRFACSCGQLDLSLTSLRRGLHALLGDAHSRVAGPLEFARLYELASLQAIYERFEQVLASDPAEEDLQKFIQANPIVLSFLSARRLWPKAPILTFFVTDFVALSTNTDLILVELEGTKHRLLKKDGHPTAQVHHAIEQINEWLDVMRRHWLACLDALGIEERAVGQLRGIVVIGRSANHDPDQLRRMKASNRGNVTIYTYDDLLEGLSNLIAELRDAGIPGTAGG